MTIPNRFVSGPLPRLLAVGCAAALLLAVEARAQGGAQSLPEALTQRAPTLRFERLGLEDGLAQLTVSAIVQDRQGFLWFATQGGLQRYDGHEFKTYAAVPFDTTSLSVSSVMGMAEASDGDLWVATNGGGLNRLDPATGRATHYRHDPDDPASLSSDEVLNVLEAGTGDVWVASRAGVDRMRPGEEGRFEHLRHDPDDAATLSADYVTYLSEDPEGYVWAGSVNGVNRIDPRDGAVTRFLYEPGAAPTALGPEAVFEPYFPPDAPGTVWLPTANGLVRLDPETGAHERFLVAPNEGGVNPLNSLYKVTPDPNDPAVLWAIGGTTGLVRFDTRTETFTAYRHDPRDPHSLSSDHARALFADRSGTMWVGTFGYGLNAFNPKSADFVHLRHDPDDAESLAPGAVLGLYEDRSGTLWVGTQVSRDVHYVTRFDAGGRVTRYRHDPGDPRSLQPGVVAVFAEDAAGHLWVGHFFPGRGLSRLDPATGLVTRFQHEPVSENARRNAIIAVLPVASEPGVLWVGGFGGLDRFDTRTGRFTAVPLAPEGEAPVVASLHEDAAGALWVGTYGGLFHVRDGEARLAAAYDARDTTSISSNDVTDILEREREPGVLWLATDGGLNRFDTRTGTARHYMEEDGLANNVVYGLLEDEAGTLWMSTNGGLSNFDPETGSFRNYGLDDGLMALEYNQNAFAEGAGGVLYFGSLEGVTAFSPGNLSTNAIPPPVALAGFKLFNEPVAVGPGSPLERPLSETERITLAHDQNEVTFDFVALHFGNPQKNRYAYRLEGHDPDWVEAGTRRSATYTNLAPGDYTFRVKAANADGVWNEEGASIGLRITPPWWRTLWAYAGFALLFVGSVVAVDRVQRRRLAKEEAARAEVREVQLRAEAQQRRREDAERLSEIGKAITSTLSIREVIDTVYEHVNALMDATVFGIGIYNPERDRLEFPAMKERGETLPPFTNDLDDDTRPAVWAFKNRTPLVSGDWANDYQQYVPERAAPLRGESVASILYLPLVHQGKAVGVITTQSFERDAYTDYHVSVLRTLATYATIAIDNAEAYERLDRTLAELKRTQAQLVQSEKLASLGALTAGIAHEIKNPLNFVNNFAGLVSELSDELGEELAEYPDARTAVADLLSDIRQSAGKIEQHGKRADGIVRSMLEHSRGTKGERRSVDLNALVEEHVNLAYHGKRAQQAGFHAEVERDYDEAVGEVEVVPQEVGRVVLNLVGNAFDAVTEHAARLNGSGGERGLGVDGHYAPKVTVSTRRVRGGVEIRVTDNGPGIPDDVRARVFEPFFTTKPAGSGTGLGLSMSYDIVTTGHGGQLDVESAPGEGTAFTVMLPDAEPGMDTDKIVTDTDTHTDTITAP